MSKNNDEYTLEELLKAIGERSSLSIEPKNLPELSESSVGDFIKTFSVNSGPDRIPNYIIYYFYKEKYNGDLSKIEFFRQFGKQFKQVRTGKQRCYLLDGRSFILTREDKIEAKFHDEREKGKNKKR